MLPSPSPSSAALVTGASSGIGVELARELAARGHNVVLVARRADRLETLASELRDEHGVRAEPLACDLTDPEERDGLKARTDALKLTIDVLVNNAGAGTVGAFCDQDPARETLAVRLNCEAVVALTAAYAPAMRDRGEGAILIVSSSAGAHPLPWYATYAATKAMTTSFAEALHSELKPHGVAVTALCPGPVKTEFNDDSGMSASFARRLAIANVPARACAREGIDALAANRRTVTPGLHVKLSTGSARFVPRGPTLAVLRRLYPS